MGRRNKRSKGRTLVSVIQDRSGSMSHLRDATISGFNEYVENLTGDGEGDIRLTLTQFDTQVNKVFVNEPIENVKLSPEQYIIGGMTALLDAVGQAIRAVEAHERKDDKVLVVIMTDGQENSSKEHTKDTILKLLKEKRKEGWEFVFLGAGEESWANASLFGTDHAHTLNYGKTARETSDAFAALATANASYSTLRTKASVDTFFTEEQKLAVEGKKKNWSPIQK